MFAIHIINVEAGTPDLFCLVKCWMMDLNLCLQKKSVIINLPYWS